VPSHGRPERPGPGRADPTGRAGAERAWSMRGEDQAQPAVSSRCTSPKYSPPCTHQPPPHHPSANSSVTPPITSPAAYMPGCPAASLRPLHPPVYACARARGHAQSAAAAAAAAAANTTTNL
jgi:hypothetical protein